MCYQRKAVYRDPNEAVPDRGLARDGLHINSYGSTLLAEFIESDVVGPENMEGKMEEGDDPEARDTIDTAVQNSAATTIAIT